MFFFLSKYEDGMTSNTFNSYNSVLDANTAIGNKRNKEYPYNMTQT